MINITIPHDWQPRSYQLPVLRYFEDGGKRAVSVWHRRAGKDSAGLNLAAIEAHRRIGGYWHLFPEQKQARKAIWNGIDRQGRRIIDQAFPLEIRERTLDNEMMIEFVNGSTWQLIGSDRYDSLVGTNPVGVVFSEYSLSDPRAWDYIRPILAENNGWAWFNFTPRGKNHAYSIYQVGLRNDDWHAELLTVDDTGMIDLADIQREIDAGMPEHMVRQEFYCSFEEGGAKQFIPQWVIEAARDRTGPDGRPVVFGVDIARFGDDMSVIVCRRGDRVAWIDRWGKTDLMQTALRIAHRMDEYRPDAVFIDEVGIGAGVVDRLRELGYRIQGINVGKPARKKEKFVNLRAEMWARMREWLEHRGFFAPSRYLSILLDDLAMVEYDYDLRDRLKLEKKSDMKERGLPSPDVADALALTFAVPVAHPDILHVRYSRGRVKKPGAFAILDV